MNYNEHELNTILGNFPSKNFSSQVDRWFENLLT